jgi:hypothetical protein
MAPATQLVHQLPQDCEREAPLQAESLATLAARWRWASLALLGLALLGFLHEFFFDRTGIGFATLVVGLGGHFIAERRQDAMLEKRGHDRETEKQRRATIAG